MRRYENEWMAGDPRLEGLDWVAANIRDAYELVDEVGLLLREELFDREAALPPLRLAEEMRKAASKIEGRRFVRAEDTPSGHSGAVVDREPRCWTCGKKLAESVARPWRIRCVRCKAVNKR